MLSLSEAILRIGKILFLEHDLDRKLPHVMDEVIHQTQAERGMIGVWNEDDKLLFETARNHQGQNITKPESEISNTIIAKARRDKQTLVYSDPLNEPVFKTAQSLHILLLRCVACAPLLDEQGEAFGFIYLDHRNNPQQFNEQTKKFLSRFSQVAAGAILNALEHRRVQSRADQKALELQHQIERQRQLAEQFSKGRAFDEIKGLKSLAMLEAINRVEKVAPTSKTVLLIGETGAGKELFAKELHGRSRRSHETYLPLNCAAIPETLLESELFGYQKNSHAKADRDKMGLLEAADGGTIFLDEIAKTAREFQSKLLRFLESGEFYRLGDTKARRADVRIIAAASPDLFKLKDEGAFLPDLFYRLQGFMIHIPPLRERREDIWELAQYFLAKSAKELEKNCRALEAEVMDILLNYSWPGNVRELRDVIEAAVIMAESETIQTENLPPALQPAIDVATLHAETFSLERVMQKREYEHMRMLLEKAGGDVERASALAEIHRTNFYKKMKRYGLDREDFRKPY